MMQRMMSYFWTGIIILAPLALTFTILLFFFNFLTEPFSGAVIAIFNHYHILQDGFGFFNPKQLQELVSQVLVLVFLFCFSVFLGSITRAYFFRSLTQLWDYTLNKIPVISPIYKSCQEITSTLLGTKTQSFKQVVMVPYPTRDTRSLGFITQENLKMPSGPDKISVFVPAAPNPTSGFVMLFDPADVVWLDMKVEDAFKCVISCGVIIAEFKEKVMTEIKEPLIETNEPT